MKNLLKITAVLFISLTTFQSCNDDNDNAIPYEPEPTTNSIVDSIYYIGLVCRIVDCY